MASRHNQPHPTQQSPSLHQTRQKSSKNQLVEFYDKHIEGELKSQDKYSTKDKAETVSDE
jgi:hypothetical protein